MHNTLCGITFDTSTTKHRHSLFTCNSMITHILQEMNSPTLQKERKKNIEVFKTEFMDDSQNMIPVEIEYTWDWYTGFGTEKVCCDFDWDCGEANISRKDLIEEVKELITEHEKLTEITFY